MKVSELKNIINRLRDDDELVILVKTLYPSVGGRPTVNVKNITSGFDWERGKVIISSEETLFVGDDDFAKAKETAYNISETLGFLWMSMSNKDLTDKQKIAAVKSILKSRGFDK